MATRRRSARPLTAWQTSAAFRAVACRTLRKWNAERHLQPKCGAKRKRDGEPCQRIASTNGRCHFHGGATPKGAAWHRRQWPNGKGPSASKKLNDKLGKIERDRKRAQLAEKAMTPEQRAEHRRRQRAQAPGTLQERDMRKRDRNAAEHLRKMMAVDRIDSHPELEEMREHIKALETELAIRELFQ